MLEYSLCIVRKQLGEFIGHSVTNSTIIASIHIFKFVHKRGVSFWTYNFEEQIHNLACVLLNPNLQDLAYSP